MDTSIHIRTDVMSQISRAAHAKGIPRSRLITQLLYAVMKHAPERLRTGRLVKYQQRAAPDDWRVFHITLSEDDYEYVLDLRKIMKMSLSHIVAYAVSRYLDTGTIVFGTDNYRFNNYVGIRETYDNCISWRFIWGYQKTMRRRH
ncbi:MAG TPA: hypothetical protein PLE73_08470 [Spirochaetota bacterium]|nr:hypothetical protein [Spirochaetota bacterium]